MKISSRHFRHPTPKREKKSKRQSEGKSTVPPNQLYEPATIASALKRARGMIAMAARLLNCNRQTIYNAVRTYSEVKEALDDARELGLDLAELALFKAIDKGQGWAICFYLKTQGRKRGYVGKVDVGSDSATLEELVLLAQGKRPEQEQKQQEGHA